ncbi:uncharacterized protein ZBAI_04982 [Zygosaccharomyces bailii ISA1307]|nr:uncharacterized protein ZBAI_04982 [Zygosaccharomyces bailii ISA1307]
MSKKRKSNQYHGLQSKRRSITGCLTCRKRRKKCDETKPSCKACNRNFLECTWPKIINERLSPRRLPWSLSRDGSSPRDKFQDKPNSLDLITDQNSNSLKFNLFVLKDANYVKLSHRPLWAFDVLIADPTVGSVSRYGSIDGGNVNLLTDESEEEIGELTFNSQLKEYQTTDFTRDLYLESASCDHLDLQVDPFPQLEIPQNALIHYNLDFSTPHKKSPGVNFPSEVAFDSLFRKCKNKEMVSDEEFEKVDIENFVFYACIKGYIPKLTTQYTYKNLTTAAAFIPQLEKNPIMRIVFLCCGATYLAWNNLKKFQTMSDELYMNCRVLIENFIKENENYADEDWLFGALQLLCNRDKNSLTATEDDAKWHLVRAFDIIRLRYYNREVGNSESSIIDIISNSNLILRPEERTLIESFIFQYSVSILFVENVCGLPNPFTIFKILNVVMKCRVYDCEHAVDWMKNPILGPSLDSFELLAKLSYIGRTQVPLNKEWSERVIRLRKMCDYYTPAAPSEKMTDIQWQNFQTNSKAGTITSRACWLFASKILDCDSFHLTDSNIQKAVKKVLAVCRQIPAGNRVWGILPWALLVTGLFSIDAEDRAYILELNKMMAERAHSYNGFRIATFLRRAWESHNPPDFLFKRSFLMRVNI